MKLAQQVLVKIHITTLKFGLYLDWEVTGSYFP